MYAHAIKPYGLNFVGSSPPKRRDNAAATSPFATGNFNAKIWNRPFENFPYIYAYIPFPSALK